MQFSIRPATMDDYEVLCALMDEIDYLHRQALPRMFKAPDGMVREEDYIEYLINDPTSLLAVAEAGSELLGYVIVMLRETPDVPILVKQRYAIIDNLGVNPNYRRQGVGQALMQHAEQWAGEHGAGRVELTVFDFNHNAQAFYTALGYLPLNHKLDKGL